MKPPDVVFKAGNDDSDGTQTGPAVPVVAQRLACQITLLKSGVHSVLPGLRCGTWFC